MKRGRLLGALGFLACLMILFPPIHTFYPPVLAEDRGIAWQMRGGQPDLVLAEEGGYRNRRFAFLLNLEENDQIRFHQLTVQLVGLVLTGFSLTAYKTLLRASNQTKTRID